jgi:hypothetical protein
MFMVQFLLGPTTPLVSPATQHDHAGHGRATGCSWNGDFYSGSAGELKNRQSIVDFFVDRR